jgi:serine/threonine-protein kinase
MKVILGILILISAGLLGFFSFQQGIKKFIRLFLAAFAFTVFGVLVFNQLMGIMVKQKKEVMVPDLTGKTVAQALEILSNLDLYIKKAGEQYNENIPEGSIISQEPLPASVVKEGKIIKVIVSSGGQVIFVPQLVGKSLREAKILLRQAGLVLGEETGSYSKEIKKDFVVAQDPSPEEIVPRGSMINLVVSLGPAREAEVPLMVNLLGQNIRTARKILEDMNLSLGEIAETVNDSVPEGTILKQEPPSDEIIDENTVVKVTVAKKSEQHKIIREATIYYEVSQGVLDKDVLIVVIDGQGEREVYHKMHSPGTKILLPIQVLGKAKARIFVNSILAKEIEL